MLYRTFFKLTACVNDLNAAKDYLTEDDMTVYLKEDSRIPKNISDAVTKIEWILKDEFSGCIDLTTTSELSTEDLKKISDWVKGQNSDGLGEGFEQQSFACYEDEGLTGYEGSNWDNETIMASFDWETNDYIFTLVE